MAYLDRLESVSSYHNLAVLDDDESDDDCFSPFVGATDQNNNNGDESPQIPKTPRFTFVNPKIPQFKQVVPQSPRFTSANQKSPQFTFAPQKSPQFPQVSQISPQFPQVTPKSPQFPQVTPKSPQFPQVTPKSPQFPQVTPKSPQFPQVAPKTPQFTSGYQQILQNHLKSPQLAQNPQNLPQSTQRTPKSPQNTQVPLKDPQFSHTPHQTTPITPVQAPQPLYSPASAYRWRKDTYPLDDYARNSRILEEKRRIKRMTSLDHRSPPGPLPPLQPLPPISDSRCDVTVALRSESDDDDELCDVTENTDASSLAGSYDDAGSNSLNCDSSNDESEAEFTQILKSGSGFNLNSNNNNGKKKTRLSQSSAQRSVNFRIQSPPRRIRKNFRFPSNSSLLECRRHHPEHSLQISSVRGASPMCDCPNFLEYNQRLIDLDGRSNIHIKAMDGKLDLYSRYFSDIFTTFLDSSWSWILFVTTTVYVGHWIIFGLLYWAFAIANDDFAKMYGSSGSSLASSLNATLNSTLNVTLDGSNVVVDPGDPCVFQVYDFLSAFLFSMESETTIGYGTRTITPVCPIAVTCLTLQCIISGIFDTWVIGLCYARMARPDARSKTIMFASKAVICKRDGKRCLLVRVANLRKSLLVSVSIRAKLISCRAAESKEKKAGLDVMLEHHNIEIQNADAAFLTTPIEYCHVIDKSSPLYGVRPNMFNRSKRNYFEVVIILTGTLESTGLTMQAQTSYLSKEIYFGHRYIPVVAKRSEKGSYDVDFSHFHDVIPEPPPGGRVGGSRRREKDARRGTVTTLVEETEDASDEVFLSSVDKMALSESWV